MTRSPASARNFRTWLFGHVLLAACTAPPRADPPPPARLGPLPKIHVTLVAPDLSAAELKTWAVAVVERALAPIPEVDEVVSRTVDGRATIAAIVTDPDAIEPIRAALSKIERDLPSALDPPEVTRPRDDTPAFALRIPDTSESLQRYVELVEQTPGVARVELCGGRDFVTRIDLRLEKIDREPIDPVIEVARAYVRELPRTPRLLRPGLDDFLASIDTPIPGTAKRLGDVTSVWESERPRPCAELGVPRQITVAVYAQRGADRRRVAADVRAALPLIDPEYLHYVVGFPEANADMAALELELPAVPDIAAVLDRCLHSVPGARAWALVRREPQHARPGDPQHARLWLPTPPADPTRTIGHVRDDLSQCAGIARVAVLAPEADADHPASVLLLGPDPAVLADLADRAAALVRDLPGVSLLAVHAARPHSQRELTFDRAAAADRGVRMSALALVVRLAVGPLELGEVRGMPVLFDVRERPDTLEQLLPQLFVSSARHPVRLDALASVRDAPPTLAPLYRIGRSDAAALELRLRRAADREAVLDVLTKDLELPPGVQLRLGREFPPLDP
jgi:hypothetical protein